MKKILLIGINARYTHSNLAIRYLRNSVLDLPYMIELKEFSINQKFSEILSRIYGSKPDVVAFSVYIWNSEIVKNVLKDIKKVLPKIKIIAGGPELSFNAEQWLEEFPAIDYIICGSGEAGFRNLLERNLNVPQKNIKVKNKNFSKINFPYLEADFPELQNKYIYYESSRGCPFRCIYCISSRIDQALEFRDLETVKKELLWLLEKKPKIIKFIDRTFNAKRDFSRKIWKFLIEWNPETRFHFEVHPDLLEKEDFEILQKCPNDLFQFEIGIQSTNPKTLKNINRTINTIESNKKIRKLIKTGNIHIHVDLIAGLPYEDFISLTNSFNEVYKLKADHFQLGFLKVLPGTKLVEKVDEFEIKYSETAPYEVLQTKWLSYSELLQIHKIEFFLNAFYNSHKFETTLPEIVSFFENPFDFYDNFSKFLELDDFFISLNDWQKRADLLLQFIDKRFPGKIGFFYDCFRWDWCKIAKSHYFPDFLKTDETRQAKKIGYEILKQHSQNGKILYKEFEFPAFELKKAIFFQPSSKQFKKRFMKDFQIACFVKIGERKELVVLGHNLSHPAAAG